MKIDCQQYSKDMELLSLRTQLSKGIPDPVKRRQIEERIEVLENELELD